ncbi:MAG: hypothetical protein JSS09_02730 [Verrucomicrobia bacterium]|nr:hypothetical protein [Verrucomicrobiota bacterium]
MLTYILIFFSLLTCLFTSCDAPSSKDPSRMVVVYENKGTEILRVEGQKLGKEYTLSLLSIGLGTIVHAPNNVPIGMLFSSPKKLTLQEGILLAKTVESALLDTVYQNPVFTKFCESRGHGQVDQNFLGLRIAFWDENVDRPLYPYLAEIRVFEGNIYCYYADPKTSALQEDPIITPYCYPPTSN